MEDLSWIREKRKRLGITQQQLAKFAGLSQSLIAKLESGRIDPAYSKVKSITEALERQQFAEEKCAKDIMHSGTECCAPNETLHAAAQKMRKKGISQMPVVEGKTVVGSVSEQAVLAHFSSDPRKISRLTVGEAMEQPFPSALPETPISAIAALLKHYPAVLVTDRGSIAGIITKADLLKTI